MRTCVVELNDTAITASDGQTVWLESPGYAIVHRDRVLVGEEAARHARLNPRATYDRFWDRLNLDPLARRDAKAQHHADLAYHHLTAVWNAVKSDADEVIFAVPGNFDKQQLGLLLGIAQACSIPTTGLIDAALAATSTAAVEGQLWHLDLQLHRTVLTQLELGTRLTRAEVIEVARTGLVTLREAWVNAIADAFVRDARFDPTHLAHTEQALYDRLPCWLASLKAEGATTLELQTGRATHRINLQRERLIQAAIGLYREIAQPIRDRLRPGELTTLLISHRLARLPGVPEAFSIPQECQVVALDANATARGVLAHEADIRCPDSALKFVTSLPARASAQAKTARTSTIASTTPTHVVHKGYAYAITDRALMVGASISPDQHGINLGVSHDGVARHHCSIRRRGTEIVVENYSAEGTIVNGERLDGSAKVEIGDIIEIGHPRLALQLIAIVEGNGAQKTT